MPAMPGLRIKDMPEAEWPREKFARRGAGALSDAELLAIFFGSGLKGINAIDLGRELIDKYEQDIWRVGHHSPVIAQRRGVVPCNHPVNLFDNRIQQ